MNNCTRSYEIYKITNLINNKMYIGLTTQGYIKRWKDHVRNSRHRNGAIYCAIRKYGPNSFSIEVIEICYSIDALKIKEQYWIAHYHSNEKEFGYNLTIGGDGTFGYKFTDEQKQKCAKARSIAYQKPENKRILSERSTGENNPRAKITSDVARHIKFDRYNGLTIHEIITKYNLHRNIVTKIVRCKTWKHVESQLNDALCNMTYRNGVIKCPNQRKVIRRDKD